MAIHVVLQTRAHAHLGTLTVHGWCSHCTLFPTENIVYTYEQGTAIHGASMQISKDGFGLFRDIVLCSRPCSSPLHEYPFEYPLTSWRNTRTVVCTTTVHYTSNNSNS